MSDPVDELLDQLRRATGLALAGHQQQEARDVITAALSHDPHLTPPLTPDELQPLVEELLVGETYFFRQPEQLAWLREEILPERRRAARHRPLSVWSCGCASGEELYTLAIILHELRMTDARLLGTDLSHRALARARRGIYGRWSFRGLDPKITARYFQHVGTDECSIVPALRQRVTFAWENIATSAQERRPRGPSALAPRFDVICCRNVLLYVDPALLPQVAAYFHSRLADGGWLLLGAADPLLPREGPFQVVAGPAGLAYRRAPVEAARPVSVDLPVVHEQPVVAPPPAPRRTERTARERARASLGRGDYGAAFEVARERHEPDMQRLALEALTQWRGPQVAAEQAARLCARHPLRADLHVQHALLLIEASLPEQAEQALRRALFLDPSLAFAHYLLGDLAERRGLGDEASRRFRSAHVLTSRRPDDEPLPLVQGTSTGDLRAAAHARLHRQSNHGVANHAVAEHALAAEEK